jgi:hypothetical protein
MGAPPIWIIVVSSAAVGALVSSIVTAIVTALTKKWEMERQDMQMALRLAELKHEQLVKVGDWHQKDGTLAKIRFIDPLVSAIAYLNGIAEYRKTGKWSKGVTPND